MSASYYTKFDQSKVYDDSELDLSRGKSLMGTLRSKDDAGLY